MRDILAEVLSALAEGADVVMARLVDVEGSGPRVQGAAMAVTEKGRVIGAVSGGCVEAAVVTAAAGIHGGERPHIESFGYSDESAFAVGLTCGGTVHLFLQRVTTDDRAWLDTLDRSLRASGDAAVATVVAGPRAGSSVLLIGENVSGTLGDEHLDRVVIRDLHGALATGQPMLRHYGSCGEANLDEVQVFHEPFAAAPRMVVVGAVDFTGALCRAARLLGYRVTVCDARPVFATEARFPDADEVVVERPDRYLDSVGQDLGPRDAVCILTHDHKWDVPAVLAALDSEVGYLGAMGSRRTHDERLQLLRDAGASEIDLGRLRSPIGLDLGARTPEETAVAICAEIIATRTDRSGAPLRDTSGPLH